MPAASLGRVFISYRRQEASGLAGRLYDRLAALLGDDQVFMDVDAIAPGDDFAEAITLAVSSCEVLLAIIGPRWLSSTDEEGQHGWTTLTTSSEWSSRPAWSATSG